MRMSTGKLLGPAAIALLLVACSSKEEGAAPASETAPAPAVEPTPAPVAAPPAAPAPTAETTPAAETTASTQPASTATADAATAATAADAQVDEEADEPTGKYAETIDVFKKAGESGTFFSKAYGYAVFPTIGKGGLGVGAAHGKGQVYVGDKQVGTTKLTQLSIGLQAGGEAFSEIIFFEDKRAFDEFTSGNFEFGAGVSAVAITAGASAGAGTGGAGAGASGTKNAATTAGGYYKGMAVFTVAKGGLMYQAVVGGQKFSYKAL